MADLPLASAINAAMQPASPPAPPRDGARSASGAPPEAIPCPADILTDALKLRSEANGRSTIGPVMKAARMVQGAQEGDAFDAAYGASGVVEKLAPAFSRGILGAGLNVIVVGTGARQLTDRHREFVEGVDQTLRTQGWGFGAVYRLTSLTQQVAVFWRTLGNSAFKASTWVLKHAARFAPTARAAGRVTAGLAVVAATPAGRTLAFLNKWIPLLNAAWVMLAAKTAWDVHHDAKSSTTSKALALAGVGASVAAVAAGIYLSGAAFMAVTFGSIVFDLLLVEARHRDKAQGDADVVTRRLLTHPGEGLVAAGRWAKRVGGVIAGRAKHVLARLKGEKLPPIERPRRDAEPSGPEPQPRPVPDPRRRLKVAG